MTEKEMKFLLKSQQGELNAMLMYKAFADKLGDTNDAATFRKLAAEEGHHAAVFHKLTNKVLKPKKTTALLLPLLYKILGKKRLYKLIAQGEYAAIDKYKQIIDRFPEVESVMNDEKRHGDTIMGLIE